MSRAFLPFHFRPSSAASRLLGADIGKAAVLALRAILRHRRGLEVAHQQVRYGGHDLAFSSHVTAGGELVIEIDVGDPALAGRLILEEELREAGRKAKEARGLAKERRS